MGAILTMVRVSVILVFAALCLAATARKPQGGGNGGNKPEKPQGGGNGGNKPEKPQGGGTSGNKPQKPEKPNKPGNGGNGGNKPGGNKPNKPNKPMSCDLATNWPCLMKGEMCVNGTKGPTCQAAETNMTMPACSPSCGDSCACLLGRCVFGGDPVNDGDIGMADLWNIIGCAGDAASTVKSKECKESCMGDSSSLEACSLCVAYGTPCMAAALGTQ